MLGWVLVVRTVPGGKDDIRRSYRRDKPLGTAIVGAVVRGDHHVTLYRHTCGSIHHDFFGVDASIRWAISVAADSVPAEENRFAAESQADENRPGVVGFGIVPNFPVLRR